VILAWQSYGAATKQVIATRAAKLGWSPETKQMVADWAQQLGWTKPRADAESTAVQPSVAEIQKAQQLEADIATVRQTVEQRLAGEQQTVEQLANRQDQLESEITKPGCDIGILEKIPAHPPTGGVTAAECQSSPCEVGQPRILEL
jgi:hypothetical protein